MKKIIVSRVLAAAFVVLGMLLGLLPFSQSARADTFTDYPKNETGQTATDLHYTFDKKFTREQVRAYIPFSTATVSKSGKTLTLTGGEVKDGESAGITIEFEGEVGKIRRKWWTTNGLAPEDWGKDKHIQEAEGLLPQALKAAKNEKLREGLLALGRTPLSDFDTLTEADTPTQIEKLAKLARDTGDPAADFLAKAAAIVAKVIVKAGVSEAVTASPDPGRTAGPIAPQPGPAPTATPGVVEPGRGQTGQGTAAPARDADIGKLIAEVLAKVGKDGVITVEESRVVRYEPSTASARSTGQSAALATAPAYRFTLRADEIEYPIAEGATEDVWWLVCNESSSDSTDMSVTVGVTNAAGTTSLTLRPGECKYVQARFMFVQGTKPGDYSKVANITVSKV